MYFLAQKEDVVRIPPHRLGEDPKKVMQELATVSFEGRMENDNSFTLIVTDVEKAGEGRIVHGDGGVYQNIKYTALVFRVELNEVVPGIVCDVLKFGSFVRFGPLDGLLHISQIMDDRMDVDEGGKRIVGKDTKRDLRLDDKVKARIVAVSINERSLRESRIGLTMRQKGLGKLEWIEDDRKKEKGEEAPKKSKKSSS
jgi:DNA-directed RNA polymerase subunit E'